PQRQNWKEQRRNEVTRSDDLESGGGQLISQFVCSVTAAVFERFVVFTPQKAIGGHGHNQQSLCLAYTPNFAKRLQVIIRMLQYVECCDDIECGIRKWQDLDSRKRDVPNSAGLAEVEGVHRSVDAGGLPDL